jgi:iron(III) transport system permease protein
MSLLGIITAYLVTRIDFQGKEMLDFLATLPFAIPGTFMGVGYALAFSRPPLVLSGTWAIIIACTVIRELPLGLRAGVSVLLQQDRSVEDASANLGASKITTFFRIIIPLARPALLVSAVYAFISTVKTLGAIIFLITPNNKVLSADVFEATVRGDVGDAAALSMVVMLVAALGVLVIYAFSMREVTQTWVRKVLIEK